MIPRMTEAANILDPLPPRKSRIKGTITINPKKPYTTDGIPASKSTDGLMILYNFWGQKRAINTAVSIPIGTPIIIAPAVTYRLPSIMGKMP